MYHDLILRVQLHADNNFETSAIWRNWEKDALVLVCFSVDRSQPYCQRPFCVVRRQSQWVKRHLNEETPLKYIAHLLLLWLLLLKQSEGGGSIWHIPSVFWELWNPFENASAQKAHKFREWWELALLTRLVQWLSWKRSQVIDCLLELGNSNKIEAKYWEIKYSD